MIVVAMFFPFSEAAFSALRPLFQKVAQAVKRAW